MGGDDRTFRVDFSSEGVSRLGEAVKKKLKEFMGDYTDDTLVEYVIVLLKNGRSKNEAKSELNVFLGDDSDSFISWLWDHLGSHLSLYVQPREVHPDGVPKTKPAEEEQAEKTESHSIESKAEKGSSIKTQHHHNQEYQGLKKGGDENEVPVPQNSLADNVNYGDEPQPRVSRTKPSHSPRSTIHRKRRRNEEDQPRQREVSQSTVSAPRRLLQFAVRDAVATSRPSNATAEPSFKRLRSVVSTAADSFPEERRRRITRASMTASIRAIAEAVKDASNVRPSCNVFDRLGRATNVTDTNNHQKYGVVAEEASDGDFTAEMADFHSSYHPRNDGSRLPEVDMSSFHESVMDSDLGYDRQGYDNVDVRGREAIDISRSGMSGGNWVEQFGSAANVDETLRRPYKDLGPPATVRNTSLRIASSVSMNTGKPKYQDEIKAVEMANRNIMQGVDDVATKSEVLLMQGNGNSTLAPIENANPDTFSHQSEKTQGQGPTGLHNSGPPTEDADCRTIFVSNVHFAATKDSLLQHFNKFGEVLKVIILTDPTTGQPIGSAYIEFMRKEAAELALSLDGTSFMSRILKVLKKSSAQLDAASILNRPHVSRAVPFSVPRYSRVPFARGIPLLYRARVPIKPGARSFQWKRGANSTVTETPGQASNRMVPSPSTRSLTYVRAEPKTNGSS